MNKNFTFKCIALFAFTLLGFKAQAQYYADGTILTKSLTVDTNGGTEPLGSEGSWYKWTPNNGAEIEAGNDSDGTGDKDSNQATITWNAEWPSAGGNPIELIKDYKIIAEEFNSCQSTISTELSKTDIDVKLVKPDVLKINSANEVCQSTIATFTLYGTPGGVISYSVTGSEIKTGTAVFGLTDGKVEIQITPDGSGDIVLTVDKVSYTATQPSTPQVSVTFENITETTVKSKSILLSAGPVISEITFDE